MPWRLVLASLALLACVSPSFDEGYLCGPGGRCPPGQSCGADGRCRRHAAGAWEDAAVSGDSRPPGDSPPGIDGVPDATPPPGCGNSILEPPEECDGQSGCTSTCLACGGAGRVAYLGRCYWLETSPRNYEAASSRCGELGGHLVTYADSVEEDTVYSGLGSTNSMWIGLDDVDLNTIYDWVTHEVLSYSNFDGGAAYVGFCAHHRDNMIQWESSDCAVAKASICERRGWTISPDGHAYLALWNLEIWDDARARCQALGGDLVSITSQAEQDFLDATFGTSDFWIGFRDVAMNGTWTWTSGEPTGFTPWGSGQPDGGEYCAVTSASTWVDFLCNVRFPALCERAL